MSDKWAEYFGTRKWRVATEVTGSAEVDGIEVRYDRGQCTVEPPGAFRSPVSGNPGRAGVLLQEVGPAGDIEGSLELFGKSAVDRARKEFRAIV